MIQTEEQTSAIGARELSQCWRRPVCYTEKDSRLRELHTFSKSRLVKHLLTLSQSTISDLSKLKGFADDNFEIDENGRKVSKHVENAVAKEKLLVMSNFSFSHSVFKRLVLQTLKNQGLFGKELTHYHTMPHFDALKICSC